MYLRRSTTLWPPQLSDLVEVGRDLSAGSYMVGRSQSYVSPNSQYFPVESVLISLEDEGDL
jgi:hypothetical protein